MLLNKTVKHHEFEEILNQVVFDLQDLILKKYCINLHHIIKHHETITFMFSNHSIETVIIFQCLSRILFSDFIQTV